MTSLENELSSIFKWLWMYGLIVAKAIFVPFAGREASRPKTRCPGYASMLSRGNHLDHYSETVFLGRPTGLAGGVSSTTFLGRPTLPGTLVLARAAFSSSVSSGAIFARRQPSWRVQSVVPASCSRRISFRRVCRRERRAAGKTPGSVPVLSSLPLRPFYHDPLMI